MRKLQNRLWHMVVGGDQEQEMVGVATSQDAESGSESVEERLPVLTTPTGGEARTLSILYKRVETLVPCPYEMVKSLFDTYRQQETWEARRQLGEDVPVRGLEYLYDSEVGDIQQPLEASYRPITYRQLLELQGVTNQTVVEASQLVDETVDTYIVNRRLDFIYTMTMEAALLGLAPNDRLLERRGEADQTFSQMRSTLRQLAEETAREFELRTLELHFCSDEAHQQTRRCPCEWVIYTKIGSRYYDYYRSLMLDDEQFNFGDCQVWAQSVERVSFFIVLLLCGDAQGFSLMQEAKHQQRQAEDLYNISFEQPQAKSEARLYRDTNQWVKLPLWTLKLWRQSVHCRVK